MVLLMAASPPSLSQDLVITGVVDGPLSGGVPEAIVFRALNDTPDLSVYDVGSANNGSGGDGEEFTFPASRVSSGTFLHVASQNIGFSSFFEFAPMYTCGAQRSRKITAAKLLEFTLGSARKLIVRISLLAAPSGREPPVEC